MDELKDLVIMKDRQAVTDSLKVAEVFEKQHRHVLEKARNLIAENSAVKNMFVETTYINKRGQVHPIIYMDRDGFTLLSMGFTGKKAMKFKLKYIEAFNKMEAYIRAQEAAKQLPTTPEAKLRLAMEATIHLDERMTNVEKDVDFIKNTSEIDSNQRFKLRKARDRKSVEVCGGKKSNFYKDKNKRRRVFCQLEHDFKDSFVISRYEDLSKKDFDRAINFISNWYPSYPLQQDIQQMNAQTDLGL